MSRLEELIVEYCPDGVDFKPMWSLTAWDKKFNGIDRNMQKRVIPYHYYLAAEFDQIEREDGDIFYISTGVSGKDRFTTEELAGDSIAEGEVVCIPWGGTPNVKYYKGKFVTGDNRIATSLDPAVLDNKYLYYWMQSQIDLIGSFYRGSGIKHPSMKSVLELRVPVPPLPVQREIVRILDNFTELTAELTAELQLRQQQFRAYSSILFDRVKEDATCLISDVCSIEKGNTPIQKAVPGAYPMVVTTTERKTNNNYQFDKPSVCIPLVSSRGHGVASLNHVYYQEGKYALGNILCAVIPKDEKKLLAKFLYYYFEQTKEYTLVPLMKGGANVALRIDDISRVRIPVPSTTIQEEIISSLQAFENYCLDILPAEIEARQKQYEYYRDKLLTFKEKE